MCAGSYLASAAELHPHWELAVVLQIVAELGGDVTVDGSCPAGGQ